MGVVNCRQYAELTNPTKQSAFQSTQKKRLFQLTNCPLLNTTQEKLKPNPYTPKMPKQIREQLNKLIQTHNGDEAAGKTFCITTQITKSLQQLVDAESFSIGGINAKQSTNC